MKLLSEIDVEEILPISSPKANTNDIGMSNDYFKKEQMLLKQ